MTKVPPVSFTPWTPWHSRNTIRNAHLPGIYLLAHWDAGPPSHVDSQAQAIVYIGETTDQSLLGRWQQFHRAVFDGKPGHRDGLVYRNTFGDEGETLHVSAFVPEGLPREMRALYIRYISHKLIWGWAQRWGSAPICNSR
jgi:hypothetical protein